MEASPPNHEDRDTIPQVLEVIKDLGKRTEPGVQSAKDKVELWGYHANLVFKPGEMVVSLVPALCLKETDSVNSIGYGPP